MSAIAVAGPVCAGKSTLARSLAGHEFELVRVARIIEDAAGLANLDREELVRFGAALEADRPGEWLADAVAGIAYPVIDALRTASQVSALRAVRSDIAVVCLNASSESRRLRFETRKLVRASDSSAAFSDVSASHLEAEAAALSEVADLSLDTSELTAAQALQAVRTALNVL